MKYAFVLLLMGAHAFAQSFDRPSHWYFHTGDGFSTTEVYDPDSGRMVQIETECDLDPDEPGCREKIYYFSKTEIMEFINAAKEVLEVKAAAHSAGAALAGSIMVVAGKTAIGAVAAPEPTVSKVVAIGSGVVAGISAMIFAWEGKKVVELLSRIRKIGQFISEEETFTARCHHVRKNFLKKARDLGIHIVFAEHGGRYEDSTAYFDAIEMENQLYEETLDYAYTYGLSAESAYEKYFLNRCGQMPSVAWSAPSAMEALFIGEGSRLPESVRRKALRLSTELDLEVGGGVEFSGFDGNDFSSRLERNSMLRILEQMRAEIQRIEGHGGRPLERLNEFRKNYDGIRLVPRWAGRARVESKTVERDQERVLKVFVRWYVFSNRYEVNVRGIFARLFWF